MADLYGVVDSNNNITRFYVSPDFGAPASNTKFMTGVERNKASEFPVFKAVNGADGYKHKDAGSATLVEKTDTEIKDSFEWKKNKMDRIVGSAEGNIKGLKGEDAQSLVGKELLNRLNSGPALSQPEIDTIQAFEDSKQSILDQIDTDAEANKFSKSKGDTVATNAPDIDVKKPGAFAVDDVICVVDGGTNPKEETATIETIDADKLTFVDPLTNETKYKQDTTWVYKTG